MSTEAAPPGAMELAALIARGEQSALEIVEAHIARIEAVNPALNAVVATRYDAARVEARAVDAGRTRGEALGPLAGVPVTIKDSINVGGLPSTFGLEWRRELRAQNDDAHVARLRAAGAIVVAKTNVAQLLAFVEADNPVYGRTNNPWNLARSCGGSSGGEGAIIAAGGSALGLGTDIGGSVRYPAAFCGIASLKPTAGRCDDPGLWSFHTGQRAIVSQVGAMARCVEDVALATATINGGPPLEDFRSVNARALRIGFYTDDGLVPSSPGVRRAVREAAAALEAAGARVLPWQPPDVPAAYRLAGRIMSADDMAWFREILRDGPVHPSVQILLDRSARRPEPASAFEWWKLVEAQARYRGRFAEAMKFSDIGSLDLVLGPPCALVAYRHGSTRNLGLGGANASLWNLLGYPAGIVPWSRVRPEEESDRPASDDRVVKEARRCEEGSAGLPLAVQVAARPWQEHRALAAMRIIEQAARRRPDFPADPPVPLAQPSAS